MLEGAVVPIALEGDEGFDQVAGRGQQRQIALGVEASARDLHRVFFDEVSREERDGAGGVEVAVLRKVRTFQDVDGLHGLGDEKVQIRVALAVSVASQVDGQAVDEDRQVGAVVGVEPADQVLLGLASPLVLIDDEARHETKDVGRTPLWAHLEVSAGNDLLGRGRHGWWRRVGDGWQDGFGRGRSRWGRGRLRPRDRGPQQATEHGDGVPAPGADHHSGVRNITMRRRRKQGNVGVRPSMCRIWVW